MALAATKWTDIIQKIGVPSILINALDNYTMDQPLLPDAIAKETVKMMKNAKYAPVEGNHQTMLYGSGAVQIAEQVKAFLGNDDAGSRTQ